MKPVRFDDYRARYDCVSMRREDGILEVVIHGRGAPDKPCLWSNAPHEERRQFTLLPSEYFAQNVYACYWFEQVAPRRLIDKIGPDNVMFETDFPHPTSLYGEEVHERITSGLSDCEESVRRKILWENAQKLYKVSAPTDADEAKLTIA